MKQAIRKILLDEKQAPVFLVQVAMGVLAVSVAMTLIAIAFAR